MYAARRILGRTEASRRWKIGLLALMALMAAAALGILFSAPASTAHASSDVEIYPWPAVEIACVETLVEEGEDFTLGVRATHNPDWLYTRMRVLWFTEAGSADESDYEHISGALQVTTWPEADVGEMVRDFHTTDDLYPENDESFTVRFENENEHGADGECGITISDNDGIGIYDLEITSEPGEVVTESGDAVEAYGVGDVIEITAYFTGAITPIDPETGQRADYAGLYIQVGENRRVARLLSELADDELVFGYTVTEEDADADGISVEGGGRGTGMYYSGENGDGGLWALAHPDGRINRMFRGLDDDSGHRVVAVRAEDSGDDGDDKGDGDDKDVEEEGAQAEPIVNPGPWVTSAKSIESGMRGLAMGELTVDDGGRDWFSFDADGGEKYIIELRSKMKMVENDGSEFTPEYVDGHLVDPSILEIVDEEGEQVLGEHDSGGFVSNFARAFFEPDKDGTYYVAIGAGRQDRSLLGFYDISVRQDDHADDFRTEPGIVLEPGKSVSGRIDSDVPPGDPGLNSWDWRESIPLWGIESLDDRDVFKFRISDAGAYELKVIEGPKEVGIWRVADRSGRAYLMGRTAPVESLVEDFDRGTYYVEVGTAFGSSGNTGPYRVALTLG